METPTMRDKNGNEFKAGNKVTVTFHVESVHPMKGSDNVRAISDVGREIYFNSGEVEAVLPPKPAVVPAAKK